MATDDLAFYEDLARRGSAGEAALAQAKRELEPHAFRELATRYRHGEGFVLERVQCTRGALDWELLVDRGRHDMLAYYNGINAKWRLVAAHCDLAPKMPEAMCHLWRDTDGLDMRAFLRVKMAVVSILQALARASGHRAPRPVVVSAGLAAEKIREYLPIIDVGCTNLATFARLPRDAAHEGLPRNWREYTTRAYDQPGIETVNYRNSYGTLDAKGVFATFLVEYFIHPGDLFWRLREDATDESKIALPQATVDRALWPAPRPAPTVCLVPASLRRRDAYATDDDVGACLPAAFLRRLAQAAREAPTERKAWWSKARLASQLRDCKASKDERAVLTRFWTTADRHLRAGLDAKALAGRLAAAELDARKGFARLTAPDVALSCTPAALATWLAKGAYDALPDPGKLTSLADWIGKHELDSAVEACDLSSDEAVRVRLLWSDLDAVVRSGAARDTKEAAMRYVMQAYRYDRPPWNAAQRKAARDLAAQGMRKV